MNLMIYVYIYICVYIISMYYIYNIFVRIKKIYIYIPMKCLYFQTPRCALQLGGAWRMIAAAVVHMCNLTSGPGWSMAADINADGYGNLSP